MELGVEDDQTSIKKSTVAIGGFSGRGALKPRETESTLLMTKFVRGEVREITKVDLEVEEAKEVVAFVKGSSRQTEISVI